MRAQQGERTRRVGVFTALAANEPVFKARFEVFQRELERLGWLLGRNLHLDYRFGAGQSDRYPALAQELIVAQPDAIVAHTTQVATALHRATHAIPIVFFDVSDPIGVGFIASLARPGDNMTGVLLYEAGMVSEAKRRGAVADPLPGAAMHHDHRRILATAIARLRAKIKYRPVVFELMPESFTLLALQRTVEALAGQRLHKQNFRRLIDQQGLVEETGEMSRETGGRPARLVRFRREVLLERAVVGTKLPLSRPA